MPVIIAAALLLLAGASGETLVQSRASDDVDAARIDAGGLWDGGGALLLVPGVVVTRDGGPLGAARPTVRGLSHARLSVQALGLSLVDPAAGVVELGLLPFGLGDVVVDVGASNDALAGTLSLRRPPPGVMVDLGVGQLSTVRGRARVATPSREDGTRLVGFVDAGSTRGDFPFLLAESVSGVRTNNDHQRANGAALVDVPLGSSLRLVVSGVGGVHQGGLPGFATAPLALRSSDALGAVGAHLVWRADGLALDVGAAATRSAREVHDPARSTRSRLEATRAATDARAAVRVLDGPVVVDVDAAASAAGSTIPAVTNRSEGGLDAGATLRLVTLPLSVRMQAGVAVVDDVTLGQRDGDGETLWLPRGRARVSVGDDGVTGFVGVAHVARAPTLDEKFAPRGFVLGNERLRAEAVSEVELGVVVLCPWATTRAVAHAARLDDAIVIVNRNAFEVVPENTGAALRAGLDVGLTARPHPLFAVDVAGALLVSELTATKAPLPAAPPLVVTLAPRIGTDDAYVGALIASRGPVAATLFGTLQSPGSTLVDARARLPIGTGLALGVLVQNLFDVQNARDQNLLPLPGRLLFLSLEVRA